VQRTTATSLQAKKLVGIGERDPLPKGYGIRTGLSDLLKPLNSEYGVTAKEDSVPTLIVMGMMALLNSSEVEPPILWNIALRVLFGGKASIGKN